MLIVFKFVKLLWHELKPVYHLRRRRKEEEIQLMLWKVNYEDIDFPTQGKGSVSGYWHGVGGVFILTSRAKQMNMWISWGTCSVSMGIFLTLYMPIVVLSWSLKSFYAHVSKSATRYKISKSKWPWNYSFLGSLIVKSNVTVADKISPITFY